MDYKIPKLSHIETKEEYFHRINLVLKRDTLIDPKKEILLEDNLTDEEINNLNAEEIANDN